MWKLKQPSEKLMEWYKSKLLPGLVTRVSTNPTLADSERTVLYPDNNDFMLKDLLLSEPSRHKSLNDELMNEIFVANGFENSDYTKYLALYEKENKTEDERNFLKEKKAVLDRLLKVFDYDGQISHNKYRSYHLTVEQGYNTCTYCNRQYVFTVEKKKKNDENGRPVIVRTTRPQLDHWFAKDCYPLLSLNLYNLIPSCSICNSSAKGTKLFNLDEFVHPYLTIKEVPDFKFRYSPLKDRGWTVKIDESDDLKEHNMIETLNLEDIYSYHGNLEVKDILDWRYHYDDTYLNDIIIATMSHYNLSVEQVYRMFFGTEMKEDKTLDRPLSKLKRDTLEQVGILKKLQKYQ